MFGIPEKQAITLTPKAVAQILKLMEGKGHAGLRLGVKKGGCAGMEYTLEFVDEIDTLDEVVEQDGARVMIAPMAIARRRWEASKARYQGRNHAGSTKRVCALP